MKGLEGNGRDLILRYYRGIGLEGVRKATKALGQDSRSTGRYFNPQLSEYEIGVLIT
jgi:hypothetical protein